MVVNKWASWCGPCRLEFPWFQSLAEKRGGQIAFLGVNANDSDGSAKTFLSELPLPYPSYLDPDLHIAQDLGGPPQAFPTTTFYDRSGKLVFTHPGVYQDESDLAADVNSTPQAHNGLMEGSGHRPARAGAAALHRRGARADHDRRRCSGSRRWSAPASPGATRATTCRWRRSSSPG